MRAPRGTAQRGSGGVTVLMSECVVLLMDTCSIFNDGIHDIVLIFTNFAPEQSPK